MNKSLSLLAGLLACATTVRADTETHARGAYEWLKAQQQPTGLVRNMTDDPFFGLYAGALTAFCYIRQGDVERAEKMFDYLDAWRRKKWGAEPRLRGFPQGWNADTGEGDEQSDRWLGDNAWLLMALNFHRARTGSDKYRELRDALADWIVGLQDTDGGIFGGFKTSGPMRFKSTEGNLDAYAALIDRPEARARVRAWLLDHMWVPEEKRFRTGSTMDETALDCVAWAVSALGREFAECLPYAVTHYRYDLPMNGTDGIAVGFGDMPGKRHVWFEGTGEMIVAYKAAGQLEEAEKWIAHMDAVAVTGTDGQVGWPYYNTSPVEPGTSKGFFSPSATWYLLGVWGLNPMDASSWDENLAAAK